MKKILITCSILTILSSCNSNQVDTVEYSKKINHYLDSVYHKNNAFYPQLLTRLGNPEKKDQWDDLSKEHFDKVLNFKKEQLDFVSKIDVKKLDESTALSVDIYKTILETDQKQEPYFYHNYIFEQMHGLQSELPAFLINMHTVKTKQDAIAYILRLKRIKKNIDQARNKMNVAAQKGIIAPVFVHERVLEDSKNIIKNLPVDSKESQHPLYKDFMVKINTLSISSVEKDSLENVFVQALNSNFLYAYKDLIASVEQVKTKANTDDGVWKFPEGEAYYKYRLQKITTTDLTAQEIHELGLKEVVRIHKEMDAIKEKVGFKGTRQDFFEFMRTDTQFYYPTTDQGKELYYKEAKALIDTMENQLDSLFMTKPKSALKIKQVEKFREKSAGKAFYNSPALDGSRPGIYYVNMYDMKDMPKYEMEALAYHEGIPGHHMQLAIAQELKDIPEFRKTASFTAYIEGWGLYSEYLPKEIGAYSNPYSDFGRLAMELWRSCRLVVDTGIHIKKWTREEGINYYKNNTPSSEAACIKMVERHIVMPAQATAYKIGMNKILELRNKAQKEMREKFDIRKFHNVILTNGAVPLNVLENLVDKYSVNH